MSADTSKPVSPEPFDDRPATGSAVAPVTLFIILALLIFWGMSYLDTYGGGFNAMVYAPYHSLKEVTELQPTSEGGDLRKGLAAFKLYCSGCHMENGQGNAGQGVPPLVGSEWVIAEGPNRLIRIVLNSVRGRITVKGQQFNLDTMPAWRDVVTNDAEIAALLSFIRGNKEWGHNAPHVTPEQVTKVREQTKDRAIQWTEEELLQVPVKD